MMQNVSVGQQTGLSSILEDYQRDGIPFIRTHKRCVLIMGMGKGKTLTTLAALSELKREDRLTGKLLIVSTKRIAENVWGEEVAKWKHLLFGLSTVQPIIGDEKHRIQALTQDADIYTISADSVEWLMTLPYNLRNFKTIVFDELSLYKNSKIFTLSGYNRRAMAGLALSTQADRVIGLTGTPLSNGAQDLFTEYLVVDKGFSLGTNRWAFVNKYFDKNPYTGARTERKGVLAELEKMIKPITYTVKGVEDEYNYSLFLREFDLHAITFEYYRLVNDENACRSLNIITDNGLTKHNMLRQISSGFVYDLQKNPVYFNDTKLLALKQFMEETGEANLLLFCHFKAEIEILKKAFPKKRLMLISDEGAIAKWNKKEVDILIANPKSAGHGLNLQTGGYNICFYTMPLSPEEFFQSIARLARKGQPFTVNVCCLGARGTRDKEQFSCLLEAGMTQAKMIERLDNFRVQKT